MGITIHYTFAREKEPESLLKDIEQLAKTRGMNIAARSWNKLIIDPDVRCESLTLHWHTVKSVRHGNEDACSYERATIDELGELDEDTWYCSGFTKTQYAGEQVHANVVLLLRAVAARCCKASVVDEAEFYESSSRKEDYETLTASFDASSTAIDKMTAMLKAKYGEENVVCGSEVADRTVADIEDTTG